MPPQYSDRPELGRNTVFPVTIPKTDSINGIYRKKLPSRILLMPCGHVNMMLQNLKLAVLKKKEPQKFGHVKTPALRVSY